MANWKRHLQSGKALREAIALEDTKALLICIIACWEEIGDEANNDEIESLKDLLEEDLSEGNYGEIDYHLNELYDYCDSTKIWIEL